MRWMKHFPVLILAAAVFLYPDDGGNTLHMIDAMGHVYWVSSELSRPAQGLGKYGGHHLFDHDTKTAWVEGADGGGIGEKIRVILMKPLDHLAVVNGYAKSPGIFRANNRVREIKIAAIAVQMPPEGHVTETGIPVTFLSELAAFNVTLEDTSSIQDISLPEQWREKTAGKHPIAMEIELLSVYPGERFDDTCLSELTPVYARGAMVDIRGRDSEVWVVRGKRRQLVARNVDSVFQLVETDKGSHWAILIEMPARTGGRVETRYRLLSLDSMRFIPPERLGAGIGELYGFESREGKPYLRAENTRDAADILIDLGDIRP